MASVDEARAKLAAFEAEQPQSIESAQQCATDWLERARQVTALDLAPVFRGGGELNYDHLYRAILAYVVGSEGFAQWVSSQLPADLLPEKKRSAQLKKLHTAVGEAEKALVRAELEAQQEQTAAKLAALERGEG